MNKGVVAVEEYSTDLLAMLSAEFTARRKSEWTYRHVELRACLRFVRLICGVVEDLGGPTCGSVAEESWLILVENPQ